MTRLPGFQVEALRAFRDRASLELKPLTLLYGWNQAGKSTLLRMLPTLADAIFEKTPIFDLTSPALFGSTFKELGWLGPEPNTSPLIRLEAPDTKAFIEIQLTEDQGIVPNRIRIGKGKDNYFDVSAAGHGSRTPKAYHAPYAGTSDGNEWSGDLKFTSMLPTAVPTSAQMQLDDVLDSFNVIQKVQWFAAARSATPAMSRISRCCLPDGSDLPSILENRKDITELASIWLSDSKTLGETVHINKDSEGKSRFELRRTGNESLPQHLAGEGVRWLLPILLAACWAEIGGEGAPTILAVEEPEARLHPNLQIALLNRLLSMINAKGIPCVLETHSIYLLRRAQLAVAQKELSPSDLAIYWIERTDHAAQVRKIEIDSDGTLRGWNPETFEEEQHLSREIFEARWKSSTT